jgi:hypothetical protein
MPMADALVMRSMMKAIAEEINREILPLAQSGDETFSNL